MCLEDQLTYINYLLYRVPDAFSTGRQSHGQIKFFFFNWNPGTECTWWTNSLVGQYLHQLSLVQSSRSIQCMQTVPCPKQVCFLQFLERTSLYFTDQGTQKENELGGPTPPWVSTYTSHLLYKIPNPFYSGAPADSPKAKTGSGTVINGLQTAKFVIISEHGGPGKLIV